VNEEDPICGMKTAKFLKDTAVYKGKTYGFCNKLCKEEFKKIQKIREIISEHAET
jgi:YHS domain-containing protein